MSDKQTGRELQGTAYHEAGHAVVGLLLGCRVKRVSIIPDDGEGTLGRVHFDAADQTALQMAAQECQSFDDLPATQRRRMERQLMTSFAGPTAEARFRRRKRWGPGHEIDLARIVDLADLFMGRRAAEAYISWLCIRTEEYVDQHHVWAAIVMVSAGLVSSGSLSGSALRRLLR